VTIEHQYLAIGFCNSTELIDVDYYVAYENDDGTSSCENRHLDDSSSHPKKNKQSNIKSFSLTKSKTHRHWTFVRAMQTGNKDTDWQFSKEDKDKCHVVMPINGCSRNGDDLSPPDNPYITPDKLCLSCLAESGGPSGSGPSGNGPSPSGPSPSGPSPTGPSGNGPSGNGPSGNGPSGNGPSGSGPSSSTGSSGPPPTELSSIRDPPDCIDDCNTVIYIDIYEDIYIHLD